MDKRIKTQYWLEFATDFISLILSFVISLPFTKYVLHKIDDSETSLQWAVCIL